ncbi:polysaccharide biosynthesis/export family protein [Aureibaculum sp. 2210JD6-5]|uniref:polysaccharide biosynthesis/export family protein n=1 Tax=Aureibaculum sp. 2210JD6-5 TaxID=3103957 RepID=UPI002AAC990F|nr:polysaccharide biosynthesis/export family protein [Aureibaculum sp. 2210JD6-5]MDY7394213.1 polysaccharide biosynthesis/export family protein [Aureibaculum sp. 2210JD6-5]
MLRKILITLSIGILISSCIPKRELTYFQGVPSSNKEVYKIMNEPYKLQVNDILDIKIKADDETLVALFNRSENQNVGSANQNSADQFYLNGYTIDRHGNIRIPYVGELNVLGYTEKEVREKIEIELAKFFKDIDDIFISVKLAGIRFTVLGEVENPGTLALFQNQVNIVEAIANAGDITITGDRKNVTVVRKHIDGTKKMTLDLTDINVFNSDAFYIQSNDIVYVEPLKQKSWGTGTTGVQTFTTIVSVLSFVTTTILLVKTL